MKSRRLLTAVLAVAVTGAATAVLAGPRYSPASVVITKNADGSGYAEGTLGGVRNSLNSVEKLSCEVQRNEYFDANGVYQGSLTATNCMARDSNSQVVSCFSFDEAIATALNGVGDDGLIGFKFDANGYCTSATYYESSSTTRKR